MVQIGSQSDDVLVLPLHDRLVIAEKVIPKVTPALFPQPVHLGRGDNGRVKILIEKGMGLVRHALLALQLHHGQ